MADWWDAALREATEVTEGTVLQEKRRNGDERRSLNHEDHEDHEAGRPTLRASSVSPCLRVKLFFVIFAPFVSFVVKGR